MERNYENDLAKRIDCELRQLPPPKAPATLAPRVLAGIEARARQPWWKKSWAHWPRGFSAMFFVASLLVASGVAYGGVWFAQEASAQPLLDWLGNNLGMESPGWQLLSALATAFASILRSGGQWFLWSTVAFGTMMYLMCVGLGTLCYRVALNKI